MHRVFDLIIPLYNKEYTIEKTILTALNQEYKFNKIFVIDDGSTDKSALVVNNLIKKYHHIELIKQKNRGVSFARNLGVQKSSADYIVFLDADDYWKKNKLMHQIKFMKKNSVSFAHCSYFIVNRFNKIIGHRNSPSLIEYNDLINSCDIGLSTVILEKKILKNLNFPNLKTKEDYVMWLKLSQRKIKIYGINKKMVYWRRLDNSLSSDFLQKISDGYKVYRIYLKKNIAESFLRLIVLSLNFLKKRFI